MPNVQLQELYEKHIGSLLPNEQLKLVEIIVSKLGNSMSQESESIKQVNTLSDWEKSQKWLEQHQKEYVDQWVALLGDKLLAVGKDAKDVYESATKQGVDTPFLARVENIDKNEHYFGGWQ